MDIDQEIKQEQLKKAQFDAKRSEIRMLEAGMRLRPSYHAPVTIRREGSRWLCILESAPHIMDCPAAYGDSVQQAMLNFDNLWLGVGMVLPHPPEGDGSDYPTIHDEDDRDFTDFDYEEEF